MTTEQKLREVLQDVEVYLEFCDPDDAAKELLLKVREALQPPTSDEGAPTETPTKSKYADTLNALVEMQESMAYAVRRSVLKSAEEAIVELERALHAKERELEDAQRQLGECSVGYETLERQLAALQSASAAPQEADGWDAVEELLPPHASPDNTKVICPECCHQFRAIPVQVQRLMLDAGLEPPFTTPPAATDGFVRVRGELIERLREWDKKWPKGRIFNYGDHRECERTLDTIVGELLAAAPQSGKKDGWISVKERLPELRKSYKLPAPYVLAVDAAGRMSVGYADENGSGHMWVFAKAIGEPTHWMPLPSPPSKAEGE